LLRYRYGHPHALRARKRGGEEVALPALVDLMTFPHLDDAASPVGHGIRNHHFLHDAGLQPLAQLIKRRLAHRRVDVVVIEGVDTEREDDWLRLRRSEEHTSELQ